jgi:hypothetical protein
VTDYEIQVTGPIGPVARSCLPGFTTRTIPPRTILAGQVAGPDQLLGLINLLIDHGADPVDIWINQDASR